MTKGTTWSSTESSGVFALTFGYHDESAYSAAVERLVEDKVASGIASRDATLWGKEAESESAKRLAWVGLSDESRHLISEIAELRERHLTAGLDHVVLCGMGGSSLAPEVICAANGAELTVLDSSDPDFVRGALSDRLERTVVVVSSKSGGTVETDSQRRAYEHAFTEAGIDPKERMVVVTDPGSPLSSSASEAGYELFLADPEVGGRYSALTAFGLVPSGLAGVDVSRLLDEAEAIRPALEGDTVENPGLRLGALLGVANLAGADKVVLADGGSAFPAFGGWAEQLLAESTGKDGKGILPVVVPSQDAPNFSPSTLDEVLVTYGPEDPSVRPESGWGAAVHAALGSQLLLWEYATAVAGRLIGINPFDQPDVESAKAAARDMLEGGTTSSDPTFTDHGIGVHDPAGWLPEDVVTVEAAMGALLDHLDPEHGYLAVQAYLDRHRDSALEGVRETLAVRTGRPTTFGWGPRFLHSTGQYHKGGPPTGVYLQVTGDPVADLEVPGRSFSFGDFIAAQAAGDGKVLAGKGRPVLRLHLSDVATDTARLQEILA
ncbi:MAG: glucose-6-phosphate isomerase [Actinomycetota bacterium]|nr:glucose-6-phosphate isomerase [Actinomycetota bacterium]